MRGTFLDNSLTYQVNIQGESWRQGGDILVDWSIEGANSESQKPGLALALIDLRKIKKNDPKAIELIEEISFEPKKSDYQHTFSLTTNASISDGTWTYSIVCGDLSEPLKLKRLDLTIQPWQTIEEIISLIENFKRFKMKALKNKKNFLDAKFLVPTSKEYGAIDGLNILFSRDHKSTDANTLLMNFHFKTKRLTYGGAGVETTKDNVKIERVLAKSDYSAFGDSLNQDNLLNVFDDVFSEITKRTTL